MFLPVPTNIETLTNKQVVVPLNIDDTTSRNILSFTYTLNYNPAVLQYIGIDQAGTLSAAYSFSVNSTTPGILIINGYGTAPLTGAGVLMNIRFQENGAIGTSSPMNFGGFLFNEGVPGVVELVWTNTSPLANDGDGPPSNLFKLNFTAIGTDGQVSPLTFSDVQVMEFAVPASTTSGSITIGSPTAADTMVTGRVLTQTGHPISRAHVYLTDEQGILRTTLSNPFGYYRFFDVPAGGTYVIGATSKRFTFTPQVLPVGEEVVNFTLTSDQ